MFDLTNTAKIVVPALALLATAVSFFQPRFGDARQDTAAFNESDSYQRHAAQQRDPKLPYLAQS